jgi:hypothetical protein
MFVITAQIVCEECGEWLDVHERAVEAPDPRVNVAPEEYADCEKCGKHFDQAAVDYRKETAGLNRQKP